MAFFNLAHLGPQDSIKAKLKAPSSVQHSTGDEGKFHEDVLRRQQQGFGASSDEPTPTSTAGGIVESSGPTSAVSATRSCSRKTPWHKSSHVKYTEMLRKHQRNPEGPKDLYTSPVTTQQEYGWWSNQDNCKPQPWTHTEKHPLVNSEMTRFVDEMSLTDKEFSLY